MITCAGAGVTMQISPGTQIKGRYEILRFLGEGGFARVFQARDLNLGRIVAIKVLKMKSLNRDLEEERFQREARLLAQLKHRNITAVYSFELLEDGSPCITMEHLEGQSLADFLLQNKLLPPDVFSSVASQVCEGLGYAHQYGVIHRDLSPANIFLIGEPPEITVKLIDFGLSKIVADSTEKLTSTGVLLGNPPYMSPELASTGQVDHRADIYALGCVMYECLSGQPGFKASSPVEYLYLQINQYPQEPPLSLPDKAEEQKLKDIIRCCLQKDPSLRFQSCQELKSALTAGNLEEVIGKARLEKLHPWAGIVPARSKAGWFLAAVPLLFAALIFIAIMALSCKLPASRDSQASPHVQTEKPLDRAERMLKRAVMSHEQSSGPDSLEVGRSLDEYAEFLRVQQRFPEAEPLLKRSLAIKKAKLGPQAPQLVDVLSNLAGCYACQKRTLESEKANELALSIKQKEVGADSPYTIVLLGDLANCAIALGQYSKAEKLVKRALAIREKELGANSSGVAVVLNQLGQVYMAQKRYREAGLLLARAAAIEESLVLDNKPASSAVGAVVKMNWDNSDILCETLVLQADNYLAQNRLAEAEPLYRRSLALAKNIFHPNDPRITRCLEGLSAIQHKSALK
jgi:eukaryotic-like serine/threonine-protein kinase